MNGDGKSCSFLRRNCLNGWKGDAAQADIPIMVLASTAVVASAIVVASTTIVASAVVSAAKTIAAEEQKQDNPAAAVSAKTAVASTAAAVSAKDSIAVSTAGEQKQDQD